MSTKSVKSSSCTTQPMELAIKTMDYAEPIEGHYLLIIIDAHFKWIEALTTKSTSPHVTIELLHSLFAQFGLLPETIVSDNGSCFVSEEFQQFLKSTGIKQITSAPYHPSSNGLAKRAVQIVKKGLKKTTEGSMKSRIAKVLFAYHNTPHCTTGNSPAKLLLGRQFHTRLDLIWLNMLRRNNGLRSCHMTSQFSLEHFHKVNQF